MPNTVIEESRRLCHRAVLVLRPSNSLSNTWTLTKCKSPIQRYPRPKVTLTAADASGALRLRHLPFASHQVLHYPIRRKAQKTFYGSRDQEHQGGRGQEYQQLDIVAKHRLRYNDASFELPFTRSRFLSGSVYAQSNKTTMSTVFDLRAQNVNDMENGCSARIHRQPKPPPPFRFLDLPGEIQNLIVKEFVLSESPITIHEPRFNRHPPPPPQPRLRPRYDRPVLVNPPHPPYLPQDGRDIYGHTRLALMLTCRKLYQEHWRTYYYNVFDFSFDVFNRFTREVPARCFSQLRKMKFRMPHRQYHERLWRTFSSMRRLEDLELWLTESLAIDETVENCCIKGVATCRKLKAISVRRAGDTEGGGLRQESPSRERELQEKARAILRSRAKKMEKARMNERERSVATLGTDSTDDVST